MKKQLGIAVFALALAGISGCAGHDDTDLDDDGPDVSDAKTTQAVSSADPAGAAGEADDHSDCNDRDHGEHARHRRHKFKVLDRLDGSHDHAITIADLPAFVPARLIARLHELDTDGDGLATKVEVKAWNHAHKHL